MSLLDSDTIDRLKQRLPGPFSIGEAIGLLGTAQLVKESSVVSNRDYLLSRLSTPEGIQALLKAAGTMGMLSGDIPFTKKPIMPASSPGQLLKNIKTQYRPAASTGSAAVTDTKPSTSSSATTGGLSQEKSHATGTKPSFSQSSTV